MGSHVTDYDKEWLARVIEDSGLNKTEFAERLGLSNQYIYMLLSGRKNISGNFVFKVNSEFKNNGLYSVQETQPDYSEKKPTLKEMGLDVNSNGVRFFELEDGTYKTVIKLFPEEVYQSYIERFELGDLNVLSDENLNDFEYYSDRLVKGYYLAFKGKGDSMDYDFSEMDAHELKKMLVNGYPPIKSGSYLIGRELGRHHWRDGFMQNELGWVIWHRTNFFHKDIKNFCRETGMITCSSRNPNHEDFELHVDEIFRIFKIIEIQTSI